MNELLNRALTGRALTGRVLTGFSFRACVLALTCAAGASLAQPACGGDWLAFRGPDGNGVSAETGVPQHWSAEKNIRWSVGLAGPGNSSPIVAGDRVFITCASEQGRQRGLYCYNRADGQLRWSRLVDAPAGDPTHGTNPYCGSSPAADGKRVVVWHGTAGAFCYDYEGQELWRRDLGEFRHIWGYGSSPVFYGQTVLLHCGPGPRTFVTALSASDGATLWQADEPGGDDGQERPGAKASWIGSWSTPVLAKIDGRDQVLVSLPHHVQAYHPETGEILWSCDGLGDLVYTSVIVGDGVGVAMGGYGGPAMGFKLGDRGNVTETNRLWLTKQPNPQRIGSGIVVGEHIFMANEQGIVQCLELRTGTEIWKDRLPGAAIWSSLVLAENRFYVTNQEGTTFLFAPNSQKLELLGRNEIGEPSNSTLALSDGQIFLRTYTRLWCIQEADPGSR